MLATKVTCPFCSKGLKTNKPLEVGKRVLCSGCGRSFTVRPETLRQPASDLPETPVPAEPVPAGASELPDWIPTDLATPVPAPAPVPLPAPASPRRAAWIATEPAPVPMPAPVPVPVPAPLPPEAVTPVPVPLPAPVPVPPATPSSAPQVGARSNRGAVLVGVLVAGVLSGLLVVGTALALAWQLTRPSGPVLASGGAGGQAGEGGDSALPGAPGFPAASGSAPRRAERVEDSPPPPPVDYRPPSLDPAPSPKPAEEPSPAVRPRDVAWLAREDQDKVNKAIDLGAEFLKSKQNLNGTWGAGHPVGMAALPGLTLLECGVPATDPAVRKSVNYVRDHARKLDRTYELALAILLLDRLGDPKDRALLRTLALRLVAGQKPTGGWTYTCPILTPAEERELLRALQLTRPHTPLDLFVLGPGGKPPEWFVPVRPNKPLPPPEFIIRNPDDPLVRGPVEGEKPSPNGPGSTIELPGEKRGPGSTRPGMGERALKPEEVRRVLQKLPPNLRTIPALQPIDRAHTLPGGDGTDNSNTQFAILGLWAARRHDLTLERTLALIVMRFRTSQNRDGSWGYNYRKGGGPGGSPAMTGAGLLGLAVGHGLGAGGPGDSAKVTFKDPLIESGLTALSHHIGQPLGAAPAAPAAKGKGKKPAQARLVIGRRRAGINMYFLWSVERVGVLYNQREIEGKEWYPWGVELLLDSQRPDGAWAQGGYPGATEYTDTCLALLFLKRANFARDLTGQLEFVIEGKGKLHSPE